MSITSRFLFLLVSVLTGVGSAGQFTEMQALFIRGTDAPKGEANSFTVYNPKGTYFIKIHNGPEGKPRVSSATISLNGKEIFSPNDFKGQTEWLEKSVDLKKINNLNVTLRSQPASALNIQIYGIDNAPPISRDGDALLL